MCLKRPPNTPMHITSEEITFARKAVCAKWNVIIKQSETNVIDSRNRSELDLGNIIFIIPEKFLSDPFQKSIQNEAFALVQNRSASALPDFISKRVDLLRFESEKLIGVCTLQEVVHRFPYSEQRFLSIFDLLLKLLLGITPGSHRCIAPITFSFYPAKVGIEETSQTGYQTRG